MKEDEEDDGDDGDDRFDYNYVDNKDECES